MPSERTIVQYGLPIALVALLTFQVVFAVYVTGSVRLEHISWWSVFLWIFPLFRPAWSPVFAIFRDCTRRQAVVVGWVAATIAVGVAVFAVAGLVGWFAAPDKPEAASMEQLVWQVHLFTNLLVVSVYLGPVAVKGFLYDG